MSVKDNQTLQRNLGRMVSTARAAHNPSDPAHATTILLQLMGEVDAIIQMRDTDAMQQAIRLSDAMPRIRGLVYKLDHWSNAVVNMGPDQVPESGADKCL